MKVRPFELRGAVRPPQPTLKDVCVCEYQHLQQLEPKLEQLKKELGQKKKSEECKLRVKDELGVWLPAMARLVALFAHRLKRVVPLVPWPLLVTAFMAPL